MLITDNEVLVRCATKYYYKFKVPTMIVDSAKKKRRYTSEDKASLDIFCDNDNIGVIVNLSQEINTIMWDRVNRNGDWKKAMEAYYDNCLLSILSEIAIDMTKREYPIDCMEELKIVRERYNDKDDEGRSIKPNFFAHVAKKKGYYDPKKKNYKIQLAPMDFLQEVVKKSRGGKTEKKRLTIGDILSENTSIGRSRNGYVDLIISMINEMDSKTRMLYNASLDVVGSNAERIKLVSNCYEHCVNGIKSMHINVATMRDLIVEVDRPENSRIRRKMWSVIFNAFHEPFCELLRMSGKPVYSLEECGKNETGDVIIFGYAFRYKSA